MALDFGQKYYYFFCPVYLAKLIWSFVGYASWKKKLAMKSGFSGKACLFTRMYQVLLSVVQQGTHNQSCSFIHRSNWFAESTLMRESFSLYSICWVISVALQCSPLCHLWSAVMFSALTVLLPFAFPNKACKQFQAHAHFNYLR